MNIGIYAKAFLHIVVVILTALVVAIKDGPATDVSIIQLVILGLGAIAVWWFPLLDRKFTSILKVIAAGVTAALTAVVPFLINGNLTGANLIVVVLAGLAAVGVGIVPNDPPKAVYRAIMLPETVSPVAAKQA